MEGSKTHTVAPRVWSDESGTGGKFAASFQKIQSCAATQQQIRARNFDQVLDQSVSFKNIWRPWKGSWQFFLQGAGSESSLQTHWSGVGEPPYLFGKAKSLFGQQQCMNRNQTTASSPARPEHAWRLPRIKTSSNRTNSPHNTEQLTRKMILQIRWQMWLSTWPT